ncbi:MarR family winged helix-turn-helix transcriptional regulator [Nocardia rhizosphaerae]|uniref:MarR family winged helix-turn-helix transcriptional regulator n=1 Tax=Nocardia rhizosphaerae TaxID=1691571 RepID=A0ABV8LAU8_9NOCA
MAERRLIGYQVKRLDQLIEAAFGQAIDTAGMTRTQWQALNTIVCAPVAETDLDDALRPFWDGGTESVADVLAALVGHDWITPAGGRYTVTPSGRAAHEAAAHSVARIRAQLAAGLTDAEFATCTAVLARMIANLEGAGS